MERARNKSVRQFVPRGKASGARVSQEDLQQAIARYLRAGGRIEKLPEQKAVTHSRAGRDWGGREIELDPLK